MSFGFLSKHSGYARTNLLEGQYFIRCLEFSRGFGHAIDRAACAILRNRVVPFFMERSQSLRAILAHACQYDPDNIIAPIIRNAFKKHIN